MMMMMMIKRQPPERDWQIATHLRDQMGAEDRYVRARSKLSVKTVMHQGEVSNG